MNFGQLKARAQALSPMEVYPPGLPAPDWPTLVNGALAEFSSDAEYNRVSVTFTSVANQSEYTLPAPDWVLVTDAVYGANPIYKSSEDNERRFDPIWFTRPMGTPLRWIIIRPNVMRIYPTPSDTGTVVTVNGSQVAPTLAADLDTPTAPVKYHEAVAIRASWLCLKTYEYVSEVIGGLVAAREADYRRYVADCRTYVSGDRLIAFQRRVRAPGAERVYLEGGVDG